MSILLKRACESPLETDRGRILVDRLWPRGLSRIRAKIDLSLKDNALSTELRQSFEHEAVRWTQFMQRDCAELKNKHAGRSFKRTRAGGDITLVYAAKGRVAQ